MLKKAKDFLKTNKYAVIWTICYIAAIFLILRLLFGFNLFSLRDWSILLSARLHGFTGFVFGILLLAALPMYMASTLIIVRTKEPLFTIVPKKDKKEDEKTEEKKEEQELPPAFPAGLPTELRGAFLRARQSIGNRPESSFDMKDVYKESSAEQPVVEPTPESSDSGLPLPDNFDFSATEAAQPAPVFKEINFGGFDSEKEGKEEIIEEIESSELIKHFESRKYDYVVEGDIVIANGLAIAAHSDSDFWIADDENWFAAGKQKPSPISQAQTAAKKHNATPAIYLAQKNIMDIDSRISAWESSGVTVLTDLASV
jgi:hypothetical protein